MIGEINLSCLGMEEEEFLISHSFTATWGKVSHTRENRHHILNVPFFEGYDVWMLLGCDCGSIQTGRLFDVPSTDTQSVHHLHKHPNDVPWKKIESRVGRELSPLLSSWRSIYYFVNRAESQAQGRKETVSCLSFLSSLNCNRQIGRGFWGGKRGSKNSSTHKMGRRKEGWGGGGSWRAATRRMRRGSSSSHLTLPSILKYWRILKMSKCVVCGIFSHRVNER